MGDVSRATEAVVKGQTRRAKRMDIMWSRPGRRGSGRGKGGTRTRTAMATEGLLMSRHDSRPAPGCAGGRGSGCVASLNQGKRAPKLERFSQLTASSATEIAPIVIAHQGSGGKDDGASGCPSFTAAVFCCPKLWSVKVVSRWCGREFDSLIRHVNIERDHTSRNIWGQE